MTKKQRPIRGAELSVFAYITEVEERVCRALLGLMPEDVDKDVDVQNLKGYYGGSIGLISLDLHRWKPSTDLFESIFDRLSSLDRDRLISEVEARVDESGNFHVRLDKQEAYLGRCVLSGEDPIRIKFRFYIPHGADHVETVRGYLERLSEGKTPAAYVP